MLLTFQNLHKDINDEDNFNTELDIALSAESFGFDSIWAVEHHFDDYAMCPDNFALLAYLAGRTSTIALHTGAVILPWNDPIRVAEKAVMLDYLTNGRFNLGIGRGLARMEYEGLNVEMSESRGRFDDAAAMIVEALETGVMKGKGQYYSSRPDVTLRPAPSGRSFRDRLISVGMSPDSVLIAADMGAGLLAFIQGPLTDHAQTVQTYRERFIEKHGREPRMPALSMQMICHEDAETAEEMAYTYIGQYFDSAMNHYELGGTHFANTKGYESYGQAATMIEDAGREAVVKSYVANQLWGTPEQILERLSDGKNTIGDFEYVAVPCFGQMTGDQMRASFELYGKEVVPGLHRL